MHQAEVEIAENPITKSLIIDEPPVAMNATPVAKAVSSEPMTEPEAPSQPKLTLIQADLAKRLDTTSSTIARRKSEPDFPIWSQSKDPQGIAWQYLDDQKIFISG